MKKTTLDIVLPVYNEEKELSSSVQTLVSFVTQYMKEYLVRIVIADNASIDMTFQIAKELSEKYSIVQAVHFKEKGRGRVVKKAWLTSTAEFVSYMDIDLSSDLRHLPSLVHALSRGYDIAIGTRNAKGSLVYGRSVLRTITSKLYIVLIKVFFFVNFSDAQCGFKAMSSRVAKAILPHVKDDEWFFDTELLVIAEKSGIRIFEEPVRWVDNPGSTVRVLKTAFGDIKGLYRIFITRPWEHLEV
ncbi:MAG: glycosyltransferase [Patescibacteria group bacterium]